jgi:hypothetical protein
MTYLLLVAAVLDAKNKDRKYGGPGITPRR